MRDLPLLKEVNHPRWRESVAWLAGIIEGEGCFLARTSPTKFGGTNYFFLIEVGMTDEDTVRLVHEVIGAGSIKSIQSKRPNCKLVHRYVASTSTAYPVLLMIFPFLSERRKCQAIEKVSPWLEHRKLQNRSGFVWGQTNKQRDMFKGMTLRRTNGESYSY